MIIWFVPLHGGNSKKFIERYRMPTFSPNGQFVAARYDAESGTRDVTIFFVQDGQPLKQMPVPNFDWQRVQWL